MKIKKLIVLLLAAFSIIPVIIVAGAGITQISYAAEQLAQADLSLWRQIHAETERAILEILYLVLILVLLQTLGAWIVTSRIIARPINRLIHTIHQIEEGDTAARSRYRSKNEFGEISVAFDGMMDTLVCNDRQLRISEERYRIVTTQSDSVIFEYNIPEDSCYYSPNWWDKFGYQPIDTALDARLCHSNLHPEDVSCVQECLHRMVNGEKTGRLEARIRLCDGSYRWFLLRATTIFDENKTALKVIGKITDIDAQKKETEELKSSAQRDLLSGLYNKITAERLIDDYLCTEGRNGQHALFVMDIDNFKSINDSLGHLTGDCAIKKAAYILQRVFRATDIAGRVGGDELMILMKEYGGAEAALREKAGLLVEEMRCAIENEGGERRRMSCSVGVSLYPRDGSNYLQLFAQADAALYRVKSNGKDDFCVLSDSFPAEKCRMIKHS